MFWNLEVAARNLAWAQILPLDEIQPWGNANYDFEGRETAGDPPERGVTI
jgi:hypothetical protein